MSFCVAKFSLCVCFPINFYIFFRSPVFAGGIFMISREWFFKLNGFNQLIKVCMRGWFDGRCSLGGNVGIEVIDITHSIQVRLMSFLKYVSLESLNVS